MSNSLRPARFLIPFGSRAVVAGAGCSLRISGAWATDGGLCNQVFTKKANEVEFAELSDLFGSGFIIEGNRIREKSGRCTITSKQTGG